MTGKFIISLDFELLWGVRDQADVKGYGENILGVRNAIPRILRLFEKHDVAATWATVGFVFCGSRDELMASLPPEELRPTYQDVRLSSYSYFDEIGANEAQDPFFFGASLVNLILQAPRQEIGTHTLSHYCCLEPGQTELQFEADLAAAVNLARQRQIELKSIVFPRDQYAPQHLRICHKLGLKTYRGTPERWIYKSAIGQDYRSVGRRVGRLLDAYSGIFGDMSFADDGGSPANVPASHFLRPCAGRLKPFQPLNRQVVQRAMSYAARMGRSYHLWWHPHNFGRNTDANLDNLERIVSHYIRLRDEYGMHSCTMAEAGE